VYASGVTDGTLDGFTVTGGDAAQSSAQDGGGLFSVSSALIVGGVTLFGNRARFGGGMHLGELSGHPPALAALTNVVFRANGAVYGGGLSAFGTDPSLYGVSFQENDARGGGGMYTRDSDAVLRQVEFKNNTANQFGGGLFNYSQNDISHPSLVNVLFSGNSADSGGGIFNHRSNPSLTNVTLVGNSNSAIHNSSSHSTVTNSILWGNLSEIIDHTSSTTTVTYSIVEGGFGGTGNLDVDPQFVNAAGGDFRLLVGSPAIDTGTSLNAPEIDLDGLPRPRDGNADRAAAYDMGAYEYENTTRVASGDAATVNEDSGATAINVLANDTDAHDLTPPLNSTLSVIEAGPAGTARCPSPPRASVMPRIPTTTGLTASLMS
jgi:hypothetical protein